MGYFVISYARKDETLYGVHVIGMDPAFNNAQQIFRVRSNAFMFMAFLNGNARVELQALMEADVDGVPYYPESFTGSITQAARSIASKP